MNFEQYDIDCANLIVFVLFLKNIFLLFASPWYTFCSLRPCPFPFPRSPFPFPFPFLRLLPTGALRVDRNRAGGGHSPDASSMLAPQLGCLIGAKHQHATAAAAILRKGADTLRLNLATHRTYLREVRALHKLWPMRFVPGQLLSVDYSIDAMGIRAPAPAELWRDALGHVISSIQREHPAYGAAPRPEHELILHTAATAPSSVALLADDEDPASAFALTEAEMDADADRPERDTASKPPVAAATNAPPRDDGNSSGGGGDADGEGSHSWVDVSSALFDAQRSLKWNVLRHMVMTEASRYHSLMAPASAASTTSSTHAAGHASAAAVGAAASATVSSAMQASLSSSSTHTHTPAASVAGASAAAHSDPFTVPSSSLSVEPYVWPPEATVTVERQAVIIQWPGMCPVRIAFRMRDARNCMDWDISWSAPTNPDTPTDSQPNSVEHTPAAAIHSSSSTSHYSSMTNSCTQTTTTTTSSSSSGGSISRDGLPTAPLHPPLPAATGSGDLLPPSLPLPPPPPLPRAMVDWLGAVAWHRIMMTRVTHYRTRAIQAACDRAAAAAAAATTTNTTATAVAGAEFTESSPDHDSANDDHSAMAAATSTLDGARDVMHTDRDERRMGSASKGSGSGPDSLSPVPAGAGAVAPRVVQVTRFPGRITVDAFFHGLDMRSVLDPGLLTHTPTAAPSSVSAGGSPSPSTAGTHRLTTWPVLACVVSWLCNRHVVHRLIHGLYRLVVQQRATSPAPTELATLEVAVFAGTTAVRLRILLGQNERALLWVTADARCAS
jgi:hypothetical protein